MVKTRQWLLADKPRDLPDLEQTFKLTEIDLPELKDEQVLIKLLFLSNDPAQRGWISSEANPDRLYVAPVKLGAPMTARGLAEVVESKSSTYQKGDQVLGPINWSEYAVVDAAACRPAAELPGKRSKTHYLGALGLTGLTAYFGLTEVGATKADDIVVISGAAGATGSMAVQIAKKIIGCKKVIGIAGSEDKCRWVEKLGADICLNYKSTTFADELRNQTAEPENFPNVYFDNVGGEILDLMLSRMARYGRIIACGCISSYNTAPERTTGLKNWFEMIQMRLTSRGFIVFDFASKYAEANAVLTKALAEDKLEIDGSETIVKAKFEDIPKTWMKLFEGSNQGKLITQLE